MMITLYTFGPMFGLPDPSPFVVKADMLLKIAGLKYETNRRGGMRKAPKGKLPFIEDDGETVADTSFIRWHLEKKYHIDFDRGLTEVEKAQAWAVEKMLEDNLYWAVLDARWSNDDNFDRGPAIFFKSIPALMRPLAKFIMKRKFANSLKAQGMGRHSRQEIETIGGRDIAAVAAILGDKPYLMGDQPCGADATCFAFIDGTLCPLFETQLRTVAEQHPNLVAYAKRMRSQYYPTL